MTNAASIPLLFRVGSPDDSDSPASYALLRWTRDMGAAIVRAQALCRSHGLVNASIDISAAWFDSLDIEADEAEDDTDPSPMPAIDTLHASGKAFVVLPETEAATIERGEQVSIRGDRIVVDATGSWYIAGHHKHSYEPVEGALVEPACDPWAEAHGYPVATLIDNAGQACATLRVDPVVARRLQRALAWSGEEGRDVAIAIRVPLSDTLPTERAGEETTKVALSATPDDNNPVVPTGLLRVSDYQISVSREGANDAACVLNWCAFRDVLDEARGHLSLVAA